MRLVYRLQYKYLCNYARRVQLDTSLHLSILEMKHSNGKKLKNCTHRVTAQEYLNLNNLIIYLGNDETCRFKRYDHSVFLSISFLGCSCNCLISSTVGFTKLVCWASVSLSSLSPSSSTCLCCSFSNSTPSSMSSAC